MPNSHKLNIVLVAPEIPGNTGSIGRTCVALRSRLILIHPLGFDLSEKAVRRAGLDYWKHVEIAEYPDFSSFLNQEKPSQNQMKFFSKAGRQSLFETKIEKGDFLIFGSETKGLPRDILEEFADSTVNLPMYSEEIRSLNLSNVATAAAYEGIRQIDF